MSNIAPEEDRFARNAIILGECLHESIHKLYTAGHQTVNPDLVKFAVDVIRFFDKTQLIDGFILNSHEKCWDSIFRKDEKFFMDNANDVFAFLPTEKVNLFLDLFGAKDKDGKGVVSQEIKDQLWALFAAMTKIAIKYVHRKRSPYSYVNEHGTLVRAYGCPFYNEVNIGHHCDVWSLTLEFPAEC